MAKDKKQQQTALMVYINLLTYQFFWATVGGIEEKGHQTISEFYAEKLSCFPKKHTKNKI